VLSVSKLASFGDFIALGTDKGKIITARIKFTPVYKNDDRIIQPSVQSIEVFEVEKDSIEANHIEKICYTKNEDGSTILGWINHNQELKIQLYDNNEEEYYYYNLTKLFGKIDITDITVNSSGTMLIASDIAGELFWFNLEDFENPFLKDQWKVSNFSISSLEFLIGDNSLVVGDKEGFVNVWFPVRSQDNVFRFQKIHEFQRQSSAIVKIIASPRNRSFLSIDQKNNIQLNYSTTEKTELLFRSSDFDLTACSFSPKSDKIIVLDKENNLGSFNLDFDHPETTIRTLFGKVWYEGYPKAEFVWQSTGGTDSFEPKLSLVPLIFGTLKGTIYAMIFSIPIAILGAIYVSRFAPIKLARIVKPTIEIMAALPSVVIGFLAGLYFSPLFEEYLMFILLSLVLFPILLIVGVSGYSIIPESKRLKLPNGIDLVFVTILFFLITFFIGAIANPIEQVLFSGDVKQWFFETMGVTYDQRNSIVVGFALGFAVIPIIFTISEDAISNVPDSLTSASLALGATKWQTVMRVVLPAAAGGIFAAIMLGLGRAIGETMIVLMATGNTPILDLSPFNGFRAMSACIAVEIPEAPVDGTLYRVLFLTAFLLFIFTFIINSLASFIGDRLRKKYARF
jgi:phosphate transport system permease protein